MNSEMRVAVERRGKGSERGRCAVEACRYIEALFTRGSYLLLRLPNESFTHFTVNIFLHLV